MTIDTDQHYAVGPLGPLGGHELVITVHEREGDSQLFVCPRCGYVTDDRRKFPLVDCDRGENPINTTISEAVWDDD